MKKYKKLPKLIVILGPTASGKTELAIQLAKKFSGEIISADSRQIYKGMNIGASKPSKDKGKGYKVEGVPHYLFDVVKPNQSFTVAEYKNLALKAIKNILKKGGVPILVGGTGLYIQAVVDNLKIPKIRPDQKLRKKLEAQIKKSGLEKIYQKLIALDPEAAKFIDPKNPRRIIRALEVILKTKKPFSSQRQKGRLLFDVLEIGLSKPKKNLEKRIEKRLMEQFNQGLVEEAEYLFKKYKKSPVLLSVIGYKEIAEYFQGKTTLQETFDLINKNTQKYAKRQMTWFKKDKKINWIKSRKQAEKMVQKFL
ncbi:MAG: tRNA (adenosine(37)-N6)-dimethylallyltransferase MiaA [Parcubacteria group bacterium]|nr:tRNA (adenosine(37)-N6)-dimethylallyltransferase MiaA [Parcubacteria group bacterium]